MQLSIQNIGKIKHAEIEITGITVIAGENDTGKSTVGKSLYSMFAGFYNVEQKIFNERLVSIRRHLRALDDVTTLDIFFYGPDIEEVAKSILESADLYKRNIDELNNELLGFLEEQEFTEETLEFVKHVASRIQESLNVSDQDILKLVLQRALNYEFNKQICNAFSNVKGEIELQIRGQKLQLELEDDAVTSYQNRDIKIQSEIIYLDDPFVIDDVAPFHLRTNNNNHRAQLIRKLSNEFFVKSKENNIVDEIVVNQKLNNIYEKLNSACAGEIVSDKLYDLGYKDRVHEKTLDAKNLSTGLKSFALLKVLLQKGLIKRNGTIILDEPEVHLHPKWQILFAEVIVLLHKEFGLHILLNTHSPYFVDAIETYSEKYGISNQCRYYLLEDNEGDSRVVDVSENRQPIYSKLAAPFQILETEKYSGDV